MWGWTSFMICPGLVSLVGMCFENSIMQSSALKCETNVLKIELNYFD